MIEAAPFGSTGHQSTRTIFGAAALGFGAWRWRGVRTSSDADAPQVSGLDADDERRVDEELELFDA